MSTLGWLLILTGFLIVRQVTKGRVLQTGEDLSDAFLAIASGDTEALQEVFAREGDSNEPTAFDSLSQGIGNLTGAYTQGIPDVATNLTGQVSEHLTQIQKDINSNVALWAISLGEKAKGYRFGATGPEYYDCSGLMWRACQKAGFKGVRFTTATIQLSKYFKKIADPSLGVSTVTTGDIVLWPGKHMGVVTTPGRFYSARSVETGIGESNIAGFNKKIKPVYLRMVL